MNISHFENKQTLGMRAFLADQHAKKDVSLFQMMAGQSLNIIPEFIRQPVEHVDHDIDFRPAETIRKFEAVGLILWDSPFRYLVHSAGKDVINGKVAVDSYTVTRQTSGSSVSTRFGSQRCFPMYTMFALVTALLSKQINGTPGILSVSDDMNAFYFYDEFKFIQRFAIITWHVRSGKWRACIKEVDECVLPEDTMVHMLHQGDI